MERDGHDLEWSIEEIHLMAGNCFQLAMTHSSYAVEQKTRDNEILEFLGDSVLQLCITQLLIELFPDSSEGDLSLLRHRIVNNNTLCMASKYLKLDDCILLGNGEENSGGRTKERILANTFEAFLGAVFESSGLHQTMVLIRALFTNYIRTKAMITPDKQILHEWCQKNYGTTPLYKDIGERGPEHEKIYIQEVWIENKVVATGSGGSKKEASNVAATNAVQVLRLSSHLIDRSHKKRKNKKHSTSKGHVPKQKIGTTKKRRNSKT